MILMNRKCIIFLTLFFLLGLSYGESFNLKFLNKLEPYEDSEYIWNKRTFDDPRFYTASFGKRSVQKRNLIKNKDKSNEKINNVQIEEKRIDDVNDFLNDPRFYSTAFGKRNVNNDVIGSINPHLLPSTFNKRSNEMDDPRLFSAAFGK
uniref:Uncharacterized protein n=1 Tax=Strongyloides stercoralis TaxID=6248 RepID=A0A0K0E0C4_STRER